MRQIKEVLPMSDFIILLKYKNGENRKFDMKPYLDTGIFRELRDEALFSTVHVSFDTIEWDNEADFDPDVLYEKSEALPLPGIS